MERGPAESMKKQPVAFLLFVSGGTHARTQLELHDASAVLGHGMGIVLDQFEHA